MWCPETIQEINKERSRLANLNLPEREALSNVLETGERKVNREKALRQLVEQAQELNMGY